LKKQEHSSPCSLATTSSPSDEPRPSPIRTDEQAKGPLVQLVRGTRRHSLGPRFDSPWERIFRLRLKNPLVCPMPKHRSKAKSRSFSHGLRCRCVWVGQGFEGFLDLREKVFFLMQCLGAVLPPTGQEQMSKAQHLSHTSCRGKWSSDCLRRQH
jgi:hypothetical protein